MDDSFEVANGDVRIRVTGLRKTMRDLERAGADTNDMKELIHGLGQIVVDAHQVNTQSGRLESTIRAGRGKTKAVIRMGGARAPYAGVYNYGWPAMNKAAAPVTLEATVRSERSDILDALNEGIEDILRKNDLL